MASSISDIAYSYYARAMMKNYGKGAALQAAFGALATLENGDMLRYAIWKRILVAIGEIERRDRAEREDLA